MPVVRISGQLIYFVHVPKCAGTAVERYLQMRFGPIGLRDSDYFSLPERQRWSKSSPQHIDAAALDRLIPVSFFDASFALVRHPADRIRSVFLFQRDIERELPPETGFAEWLAGLPKAMRRNPYYLDNHVRPMSDLVPADLTVFRMEDGMGAVVGWLDEVAGADDGAREIHFANSYAATLMHRGLKPGPRPEMTPEVNAHIASIYAADFERFGYAVADSDHGGSRAAAVTK